MGYELKPGDKVLCDFSRTSYPGGGQAKPRVGTVVAYEGQHHVEVDFGRGFQGHSGSYDDAREVLPKAKRTRWYVSESELSIELKVWVSLAQLFNRS
jgi:hypothetical protein